MSCRANGSVNCNDLLILLKDSDEGVEAPKRANLAVVDVRESVLHFEVELSASPAIGILNWSVRSAAVLSCYGHRHPLGRWEAPLG